MLPVYGEHAPSEHDRDGLSSFGSVEQVPCAYSLAGHQQRAPYTMFALNQPQRNYSTHGIKNLVYGEETESTQYRNATCKVKRIEGYRFDCTDFGVCQCRVRDLPLLSHCG